MLVSLPTGKVVEMSLDYYLSMSDDTFQQLIAADSGEEINDPFYDSVLYQSSSWEEDQTDEYIYRQDLTQLDRRTKYDDLDIEKEYED